VTRRTGRPNELDARRADFLLKPKRSPPKRLSQKKKKSLMRRRINFLPVAAIVFFDKAQRKRKNGLNGTKNVLNWS